MQSVLKTINSKNLAGIFIWIPMIESDGLEPANNEAKSFTDPRVEQYFDKDKAIGTAYKKHFGLTKTAWDMFLVYGPDVVWEGDSVPTPTFYMHQMNTEHGSDPQKYLKPDVFLESVKRIVNSNKKIANDVCKTEVFKLKEEFNKNVGFLRVVALLTPL